MVRKKTALKLVPEPVKLDLGAGKGAHTPKGFEKIDIWPSDGVRVVDLAARWPWPSDSVDEAQAVYLLQCLTPAGRIMFVNELYRVLKPGSRCVIIVPHWCASRAYGDLSWQFPPVSEAWFPWLNKAWRDGQNCVVNAYDCDFEIGIGYNLHPMISTRSQEYQQNAVTFWKEAAQDIVVTLTKR